MSPAWVKPCGPNAKHLPTWRAHNEQAMAHAAIAYAKAGFRQRMMAVTTSIGPGATNLLTAAALAHVNRLPLLMLPGDTFASRAPDPVLQQLEDPGQGDVSVNDAFRPLTRFFDRISRPEQILQRLAPGDRGDARPGHVAARSAWPCPRTCRPRPSTARRIFCNRRRCAFAAQAPMRASCKTRWR